MTSTLSDETPMTFYFPPSLKNFEPKRIKLSTWIDHIPFAYDLVAALKPKIIVELGSHNAVSFFSFCQSVKEHNLDTVCYAVDTWEGDQHTGAYDSKVYDDVAQHAREHYRGFTYLMKMLFAEAANHFDDDTIDLLHIDGLHTYEAVKEDFETWYPKVRPGGIILFHDVMAKRENFGVWKYWQLLEHEHETFKFHHGFGLGVLRKPGDAAHHPLFKLLFDRNYCEENDLRDLYVCASEFLEAKRKVNRLTKKTQIDRDKHIV